MKILGAGLIVLGLLIHFSICEWSRSPYHQESVFGGQLIGPVFVQYHWFVKDVHSESDRHNRELAFLFGIATPFVLLLTGTACIARGFRRRSPEPMQALRSEHL
jgi:hypothetical protein